MTGITVAAQIENLRQRRNTPDRSAAAFLQDIACAGGYWGAVEDGVKAEDYDLHEAVAYTWNQVVINYQAAERALAQFEVTAKAAGLDVDGVLPEADYE